MKKARSCVMDAEYRGVYIQSCWYTAIYIQRICTPSNSTAQKHKKIASCLTNASTGQSARSEKYDSLIYGLNVAWPMQNLTGTCHIAKAVGPDAQPTCNEVR